MDRSRVAEVGPDRAAAEWILRLGGSVKFKGFEHWNSNYNQLPSGSVLLEAIDANGLEMTSNGLEHLGMSHIYMHDHCMGLLHNNSDGLCHLQSLSLSACKYLYDEGLTHLQHVHQTLLSLDLSHCTGLSAKGLGHLASLKFVRSVLTCCVD